MRDSGNIRDSGMASVHIPVIHEEDVIQLKGHYHLQIHDEKGNLVCDEPGNNMVVTVGKNFILDTILAGSGYTTTGPYMGLISSTSFTAIALADTMASHSGWLEAGGTNAPTMSSNRATLAWNAASGGSKSLSANASFSITGSGTVKGFFVVLGSGAVNTKDSTAGTLLSAALFGNGDKVVASGYTLTVSYTLSI
jgi:hypothetical protein